MNEKKVKMKAEMKEGAGLLILLLFSIVLRSPVLKTTALQAAEVPVRLLLEN